MSREAWFGLAVGSGDHPASFNFSLFPTTDETADTMGGLMLGGSIGFVLERRWVKFSTPGWWWQYVLRLLI